MEKIKILLAHNYYLLPGGEDTAFEAEVSLLRDHGHEVIEYVEDNHRIAAGNQVSFALQTVWSWESYRRIKKTLQRERPQLAHFHNTFPLISPAAYYACREERIPIVQSLDNPRLICPSANFYRDGHLCQDCLGRTPPWPSVLHRCYHRSVLQTSVVATMLSLHRRLNTWNTKVDYYLVATEFYRRKFMEADLPAEKLVVIPHFIDPDPQFDPKRRLGNYVLYMGRLDPEKGIRTMLSAWKNLPGIPLKIRGDGQLKQEMQDSIRKDGIGDIEMVGRLDKPALMELVKGARFLIWPSEGYYETFGYVAVESFSCGVPVIASNIGVMGEIVADHRTGLLFSSGDPLDLAHKVKWAWEHPAEMADLGENARREYELKYTAEQNYRLLVKLYQRTLGSQSGT